MQPPGATIKCLRCGAGNVLGQSRCWRCGASLPPPEELYRLAPHGRQGRRVWLLVVLGLGVLGLGGALLLARTRQWSGFAQDRTPGVFRPIPPSAGAGPSPLPEDPLIAEARRTIQRLQQEHGLAPPPTDEAGRVHLRSGGTISREEWERAARSLQPNTP